RGRSPARRRRLELCLCRCRAAAIADQRLVGNLGAAIPALHRISILTYLSRRAGGSRARACQVRTRRAKGESRQRAERLGIVARFVSGAWVRGPWARGKTRPPSLLAGWGSRSMRRRRPAPDATVQRHERFPRSAAVLES